MARSFFNGLLAGGILGAIAYMFMAPTKKQMISPKMLGKSRKVRKRAERMVAHVSDGVKDISNILKK
jgi:gas vesicle protein